MGYVDYASPEIVVVENVRTLMQCRKQFDNEVPLQIQDDAFRRRGYYCFHELVSSTSFGLMQSRTRLWAIYIKHNGHQLLWMYSTYVYDFFVFVYCYLYTFMFV